MFYDRKIKYLDYYENGERIRGAGFLRLEVRDGSLRVELSVTGLHPTDTFERDILLEGDGKEGVLGRIMISGGRGAFRQIYCDLEHIGMTGIGYGEARGIRISLGASREIACSWQEQGTVRREKAGGREENTRGGAADGAGAERTAEGRADGIDRKPGQQGIREGKRADGKDRETVRQGQEKERGMDAAGREAGPEGTREESREIGKEGAAGELEGAAVRGKRGREEKLFRLMDDKWQQLYAIYPHIRPFGDDREYISVRPADFVIFSSESYKAANNSFLLHGYYNYKHLILTRAEKKGELRYYIGVPGNFYEREKQVAILFGFESFECAEEPAQAGDFGYYMMRTEL